jgi:hypothetical protein
MWDIRESREIAGWWDVVSGVGLLYCSAPSKNRAWFIAQILNGGIKING